MYDDRVVVPKALRQSVITILHSAHQGVSTIEARARSIVFWPGMSQDIQRARDSCRQCCRNAPSQAATPAIPPQIPATPFECIAADFCESHGHQYLVVADRLSGWVEVFSSPSGSSKSTEDGLVSHLRSLFRVFGVPLELSSDGGPQFMASTTEAFLKRWGIHHRVSSAYFPQSNGRAEVAVKTAKRLLLDNISPSGSLNNDRFLRGILQLRNTPNPDCNVSPAQIVFGRQVNDAFTFVSRIEKFKNPAVQPIWRDAWKTKENALRTRFTKSMERLNAHARTLPPLLPGMKVFIQNQTGSHPTKWDKSGIVLEAQGNDQYLVKVDGTGRLTLRNRRVLRQYTDASPDMSYRQPAAPALEEPVRVNDEPPWNDRIDRDTRATLDRTPQIEEQLVQPQEHLVPQPPPPSLEPAAPQQPSSPALPAEPAALRDQQHDVMPQSTRPRRERKQRKLYWADTGTWETPG